MGVQDWIRCPECGSDEAVLIGWGGDIEATLGCPDCDERFFEAYWAATESDAGEKLYGD